MKIKLVLGLLIVGTVFGLAACLSAEKVDLATVYMVNVYSATRDPQRDLDEAIAGSTGHEQTYSARNWRRLVQLVSYFG